MLENIFRKESHPRSHYGCRSCFSYNPLEWCHVDLAESSIININAVQFPHGFALIADEMFEARTHSLTLNAVHKSSRQLAGQNRIFAERFKVSTSTWITMNVHRWSKNNLSGFVLSLFSNGLAHFLQKSAIPCCSQSCSIWETCCRQRTTKA